MSPRWLRPCCQDAIEGIQLGACCAKSVDLPCLKGTCTKLFLLSFDKLPRLSLWLLAAMLAQMSHSSVGNKLAHPWPSCRALHEHGEEAGSENGSFTPEPPCRRSTSLSTALSRPLARWRSGSAPSHGSGRAISDSGRTASQSLSEGASESKHISCILACALCACHGSCHCSAIVAARDCVHDNNMLGRDRGRLVFYLGLQAMHDMCKECLKSGGGCLHRRPCTFSEVFSELPLVALLTSFCAIIVLLRAGPCLVRPNSPISGLHYAQQAPSVYIKKISSLCQVGQALFVRL